MVASMCMVHEWGRDRKKSGFTQDHTPKLTYANQGMMVMMQCNKMTQGISDHIAQQSEMTKKNNKDGPSNITNDGHDGRSKI